MTLCMLRSRPRADGARCQGVFPCGDALGAAVPLRAFGRAGPSTWGFLGCPFPSDQSKLVHGNVTTISFCCWVALRTQPAGLALPSLLVLSAPFGPSTIAPETKNPPRFWQYLCLAPAGGSCIGFCQAGISWVRQNPGMAPSIPVPPGLGPGARRRTRAMGGHELRRTGHYLKGRSHTVSFSRLR